jgi:integrase
MNRPRQKQDGLPYRVYERRGARIYSIGYKQTDGKWSFRYSCPAGDKNRIEELRRQAIAESVLINHGICSVGSTEELIEAWFGWQESLPGIDLKRRADSTLRENRNEARNLKLAFGHMNPSAITKTDGYTYLDACVKAGRPEKGNKEISLLRVILEYGVRVGRINVNPLIGLRKNQIARKRRLVSDSEMALALEIGRHMGGSCHIVALALKTAWLCVRRSVEVRGITRDAIQEEGILWRDGKSKTKPAVLIKWTDELRATVNEVLAIKRHHVAGSMYVFGNMRGQRYTRSGWKTMLHHLMSACVSEAGKRGIEFQPFSLQDCRPKGVSDKLASGQTDTQEAAGHTSDQMIRQVYDRRMVRKANPVK